MRSADVVFPRDIASLRTPLFFARTSSPRRSRTRLAFAFAPLLPLILWGNRRPAASHVVFALHLYAFLLIVFCVDLLVVAASLQLGGAGLASHRLDVVLYLSSLSLCGVYLHRAISVVYGARTISGIIQAITLTAAVGAIVLGYRFAVFLITLFSA